LSADDPHHWLWWLAGTAAFALYIIWRVRCKPRATEAIQALFPSVDIQQEADTSDISWVEQSATIHEPGIFLGGLIRFTPLAAFMLFLLVMLLMGAEKWYVELTLYLTLLFLALAVASHARFRFDCRLRRQLDLTDPLTLPQLTEIGTDGKRIFFRNQAQKQVVSVAPQFVAWSWWIKGQILWLAPPNLYMSNYSDEQMMRSDSGRLVLDLLMQHGTELKASEMKTVCTQLFPGKIVKENQ